LGRLLDLYRHTDPVLARALGERNALAAIASGGVDEIAHDPKPGGPLLAYFTEAASGAARFMARPDGPRVGALAFDGWDTHSNEGAAHGRLSVLLGALDGALAAIEGGNGCCVEGDGGCGHHRIWSYRAH
jgi:uncharacterized protein (DUF1501 family)